MEIILKIDFSPKAGFLATLFVFLLPFLGSAQYSGGAPYCGENGGLVINEWSNGTGGAEEYIEFVVVGIGNVNLEGYIINDNSAAMSGVGNATGYVKFGPCYNAVPAGSIIVVYNAFDRNPTIPPDDPTDSNGDEVYIIPHNHGCMEACYSNPTSSTDLHCPCIDPSATSSGWPLGFSNTNDLIQVLDPCETVQHALSYGLSAGQVPASISGSPVWVTMGAGGSNINNFFNSGNWNSSANFSAGTAAATQTPGAANNAANATFISNAGAAGGCNGLIERCEKTDAGDVLNPSDAATNDLNPGTPNIIELCEGDDLSAFSADYSAFDEMMPPASFNGSPYEYAFVLVQNNPPTYTIVDVNTTGDFDLSAFGGGSEFLVWGFSYIQTNGSVDVVSFLTGQGDIQNVQNYSDCGYNGDLELSSLTIQIISPTPVALNPLGPFCDGSSAVPLPTTQDGSTGTWSGPGVNGPGDSFDPSAVGSGSYTLTFTPTGGCRGGNTTMVSVTAGPTPGAPSGPLQICYTLSPFSFTDNLSVIEMDIINGQGGVTVNWYEDAALTNPIDLTNNAEVQAWVLTGPTALWATLDNGSCESGSVMVSIQVGENPAPTNGSLTECESGGIAIFNPSDADGQFTGGMPGLTVSYHNSLAAAQNDVMPITGIVSTPTTTTIFVRVENAAGCFGTAELTLNVLSAPTATSASLTVCDNGASTTYDLTSLEASILNGQSGTVTFYTDMAATMPIGNPSAYVLPGGGTVYAVVDNGACPSAPAPISLSTFPSFDATMVGLTFNPATVCTGDMVDVSVSIPFDPVGSYTIDLLYGPVGNPNIPLTVTAMDGDLILSLAVNQDLEFQILSVSDGTCTQALMPPTTFTLSPTATPSANATSITNCPGSNVFDLTVVDNVVNGGTGFTVLWYTDAGTSNPIGNPANFNTGAATTVFALVDAGGGCTSPPVPVELLFAAPPTVSLMSDPSSACGSANVTLTFSFPDANSYNLDLNVTDGSGSTISTYNGLVNGGTLNFPITETTTFNVETVETAAGCIFNITSGASVTVTISGAPMATDASLAGCDTGGGTATFDLTSVNGTVNGGTGFAVNWFTDAGATVPIPDPTAFVSGNTTVYATVTGPGCPPSAPAEVDLTVNAAPTAVPAGLSLCDEGGGTATFDLTTLEGTINAGSGLPVSWFEDAGLSTPIGNPGGYGSGASTIYAVVSDGSCSSAAVMVTLGIDPRPAATPTSQQLCDEGGNQATFNLTGLNNTVNNGAGHAVNWFTDAGLGSPIGNPAAFVSGPTAVYAQVDDGTCTSEPVMVELTIAPAPSTNATSLELCDDGSGQATFDLTTVENTVNNGSGDAVSWFSDPGLVSPIGNPASLTTTGTTVYAVVDNGQCSSPAVDVELVVAALPPANAASLDLCDDGSGQASFNLLGLNNIVNGGSGAAVNWFEDAGLAAAIGTPGAYLSGTTTVYAQVDNGQCVSAAVAINLTVSNTVSAFPASATNCDNGGGQATFDLTALNPTVNGGSGLNVQYYTDAGLTNLVSNPMAITTAGATFFAIVTDGACTSSSVAIDLIVAPNPTGNPTSLEACDEGAGQATFDLTAADGTVNGGSGNNVLWYETSLPGGPIANPTAYGSGSTTVYAVVDDGTCTSEPVPVDLTVSNAVTAFPAGASACDDGSGQAAFDLFTLEGVVNGGSGLPVTWLDAPNGIGIGNPGDFNTGTTTVYAVVTDGICASTPTPVDLTVLATPTAQTALLTACADQFGQGTYDLTAVESTVNGGTGFTVNWFTDFQGTTPVADPTAYITALGAVYAEVTDGTCSSALAAITLQASFGPTLDLQVAAPISCAGAQDGALDLSVLGTPTFTFAWSDGSLDGTEDPTGLGAGTYTVTVTDGNGCPAETSISLTAPAALSLNCSEDQPVSTPGGNDGSALINLTGGTAAYSVSWAGPVNGNQTLNSEGAFSINDLTAGTYSLDVVDANGCTASCSFTINEPGCDLTLDLTGTGPSCAGGNDGSLTLVANSSQPLATIDWSGGLTDGQLNQTDLPSGTYSVTVTDVAGCEDQANLTLTAPAALSLTCAEDQPVSTPGGNDGSALINLTGGTAAYSVSWAGPVNGNQTLNSEGAFSINDLTAGTYSLDVVDANGCTASCSFTINEPGCDLGLDCSGTGTDTGISNGEAAIDIMGGTAGYSLTWVGPSNGSATANTDGVFNLTGLAAGAYDLTVTDASGCTANCSFTIAACDLVLDLTGTDPNCFGSSDGSLNLSVNSSQGIASVDWSGSLTDEQVVQTGLPAGAYGVTVTDDVGCVAVASLTLQDPPLLSINCDNVQAPSQVGGGDGALMLDIAGGSPDFDVDWTGPSMGSATVSSAGVFDITGLVAGAYSVTVTDANGCSQTCDFTIPSASCDFAINLDPTDASCNGGADGAISMVLLNGAPTYTFDWSDDQYDGMGLAGDLTGLPAGNYAVTVTDNDGCMATGSATVGEPAAIELACAVGGNPSAAGATDGNITVDIISGPGAPFTLSYLGDNGQVGTLNNVTGNTIIGNLGAATFDITVTNADNCSATCQVTLTEPGCALSLSETSTDLSCDDAQDGAINLTATGGDGNYTYDWSQDVLDGLAMANSLAAGAYSVTVTDGAGCRDSLMVTLTAPAALNLVCSEAGPASAPGVADGEAEFNISGGTAPYELVLVGPSNFTLTMLPTGATNLPGLLPGSYTTSLTDANGCTTTCVVVITDNSCTFNLAVTSTMESCDGAADGSAIALPMGGAAPHAFAWSNLATTDEVTGLAPGPYTVTVTDANGCIAIQGIVIDPGPSISMSVGQGGDVCAGECFGLPFSTSDITGNYSFTYDITGTGFNQSFTETSNFANDTLVVCPQVLGLPEGEAFTLTVTGLDAGSCTQVLSITRDFFYLEPATGAFSTTLCPGDSLDVGGTIFHEANPNGPVVLPNAAATGCDSLVVVSLDFYPVAGSDLTPTICTNDSLAVAGTVFDIATPSGTVTLPGAGANGCDSLVNVSLSFFPTATGNLDTTLCAGDTLTLGNAIFHANNPNDIITLPGAAVNGCDSMVQVNVAFLPALAGTFSPVLCPGDTVTIGNQAFFAGNQSGTVVLPAVNGCDSTVTVNASFLPPAELLVMETRCAGDTLSYGGQDFFAGNETGNIVLPGASVNGCDSVITVNLTFLPPSSSDLVADICPGDTIIVDGAVFDENNLSGSVVLAGASEAGCDSTVNVALTLLAPGITDLPVTLCAGDTLFVGDTLQTDAGAMTYVLEGQAANGCDSIVNVDLSFFPPAEGLFAQTFCFNETVMVGDSTFSSLAPSGTVVLPGAAVSGCDSTVVVDLTFLPEAVGTLDTILCFGESIAIAGQIFDASQPAGSVLLPGAAAGGCDSTLNVAVNFQPELSVALAGDTTICRGEEVRLQVVVQGAATVDLVYNDGVMDSLLEGVTNGQFIFLAPQTGTTVQLVSADANGNNCPVVLGDPVDITVNTVAVGIAVTSEHQGFGVSCANAADGGLLATATGASSPVTFAWDSGQTTAAIGDLPPGDYRVVATDATGCQGEALATLTAPDSLRVDATGSPGDCFGNDNGSLTLTNVTGGSAPYEYSLDGIFFEPANTLPVRVRDLAAGVYAVHVQDANDCQEIFEVFVPEREEMTLDLGDDHDINVGDSIPLLPDFNFTAANWVWEPRGSLTTPDSIQTFAKPTETTTYRLTMFDEFGCSVSDLVHVFVSEKFDIYMPSAFSPNGDGVNEVIYPFAGDGVERIERFAIFDRWGNQVWNAKGFQARDPAYGWNGKFDGRPMNAGVFVYYLEVLLTNGETILLEGDITLVR